MGKANGSAMLSSFARSSSDLSDGPEEATFLDLYVANGQSTKRITIAQDLVDFAGLGDAMQTGAAANMARFVSECEQRFSRLHLDSRLVNVRARRRVMVGGLNVPHEGRKLYSFGTLALSTLLESISPELEKMTRSELGSRFAFLMRD